MDRTSKCSESDYLIVGKIGRARGLKGECRLWLYMDDFRSINKYKHLYLSASELGNNLKKIEVVSVTLVEGSINLSIWVKFKGVEDRSVAEKINNHFIFIHKSELPKLSTGQYYWHELESMDVFTEKNSEYLGKVSYLFNNANLLVMVVEMVIESENTYQSPLDLNKYKNKKEKRKKLRTLIPFLKDSVVKEVDMHVGKIIVDWDTSN